MARNEQSGWEILGQIIGSVIAAGLTAAVLAALLGAWAVLCLLAGILSAGEWRTKEPGDNT